MKKHYSPILCNAESDEGYVCDLAEGHLGNHKAHGFKDAIIREWMDE